MKEANYNIAALIVKQLKEELSAGEQAALQAWLAESLDHSKLLERLANEQSLQSDIAGMAAIDTEQARQKMVATLFPEAASQAGTATGDRTPLLRSLTRNKRWYAAAAILLLVFSAITYRWLQHSPQQAVVAPMVNDVGPGSSKALLTLANGATVTLDSAGKQVIQQGTTVIRQQNGQLQYHVQGAAALVGYSMNTLATPRGGQYQLVLPDGSKVWLNAASSLRYPTVFSDTGRLVELTGEAYFEVQSLSRSDNKKVPFRVKVNNMVVEVLGTHFNIMAYSDEQAIRTTLLEGSVRVSQNSSGQVLRPGEQAVVAAGNEIKVLHSVNVQEAVAWKNGVFQFNRAGLPVVMRQLSRWYDVEVVYEGKIPDQEFLGKMQRELNLSEVLSILEKSGVRFRMEGRKIIVSQ
ncbi:FecR family protein [Chitinophaga rupis]|uniref:FecR family protein n=1 Tax=Chitinophaga rupis TaxID=573321 RepID=A0A1H8C9Z9_9BACT|nr:FecR family protein [Chitinophaga rupis]SEM92061.1 FecR family protein [Chitinophaga rupis]